MSYASNLDRARSAALGEPMEKLKKISLRAQILAAMAVVLFGVLALAYANRAELIIKAMGIAMRAAEPTAPHRPIDWQTGVWGGTGPQPPNVIVILTDDMGFNDVSFHGGGLIETPHIDRLAQEGVRFANGYAGSAVCAPSRAMLLTGRYSTRFGFEFTPVPDQFRPILQQLTQIDPAPRTVKFGNIQMRNWQNRPRCPMLRAACQRKKSPWRKN